MLTFSSLEHFLCQNRRYKHHYPENFVSNNKQDGMSSFGCTPDGEWVLKINYARGLCGRPYIGSLGHGFIKLTSKGFRQNNTTDPHGIVGSTEFITAVLRKVQPKSVQPSSVPKRRFWQRESSTKDYFRIKIGLNFWLLFLSPKESFGQEKR